MASAQVQHDARVIGCLAAEAFHTTGSRIFSARKLRPNPPRKPTLLVGAAHHLPQPFPTRFWRNPTSFHAPLGRLTGPNQAGFPPALGALLGDVFVVQ